MDTPTIERQGGKERRTQLDKVSNGAHDDETHTDRLGDFDEFTFVRLKERKGYDISPQQEPQDDALRAKTYVLYTDSERECHLSESLEGHRRFL